MAAPTAPRPQPTAVPAPAPPPPTALPPTAPPPPPTSAGPSATPAPPTLSPTITLTPRPTHTRPPFQAVAFFPSARVNFLTSSAALGDMSFVDYVIKSGRAVIYPIYAGTYERHPSAPMLPGPTLEREMTVKWSKDLGRSIDYLESRRDIDRIRIGYLGVSQGAAYGVMLAAVEERLKAVVFLDGGYFQQAHPVTGMDQADFAPRVTQPVLMVNGRYDATFPLETAQLPLFRMLGTPSADKRQVVFDTPHEVTLRRTDLVKEVLAWYDRYLGRVE